MGKDGVVRLHKLNPVGYGLSGTESLCCYDNVVGRTSTGIEYEFCVAPLPLLTHLPC